MAEIILTLDLSHETDPKTRSTLQGAGGAFYFHDHVVCHMLYSQRYLCLGFGYSSAPGGVFFNLISIYQTLYVRQQHARNTEVRNSFLKMFLHQNIYQNQ